MKIMLFITGLGMGGAEKIVCELADQLYASGHQVSIVYFTGNIVRRPQHKEIEIYKLELKLNFSLLNVLKNLLKLVDTIKPDVIHAHMFHANMMARYIKLRRKNIRVICSSHSNYEGGKLRMVLYACTENLCDVHTNVSDNAAQALMRAGAVKNKKIITVYNGIETQKYKFNEEIRLKARQEFNFNHTTKVMMTIGRIDTPKDYPTLLKAFKIVLKQQPHTFLLIVGDGPKKQEIEALSISLGMNESVKFLGIRNDIPELLNACDLFVSSSAWEGFGLAILEAMLCQKPIVATQTDGAMELLPENSLVECGNHEALADEILKKMSKSEKTINYENVNSFDWNKIIKIWENIYEF